MDITKCSGNGCDIKNSCKRFTSKPDPECQSYFVEPPIKDGSCEMYYGQPQQGIMKQLLNIVNGKF